MINGLVLITMDNWITDEMRERIRGTSLANAKQLICGAVRNDLILDVAANSAKDLNAALGTFAEVQGVKGIIILRVTPGS
jgi:hypothetical protein